MIEVNNLSKDYSKQKVLKNISITFPRYGLVVIYGPSGCGKTTFFNAIAGLLDFDGQIIFDGLDISSISENKKAEYRLKNIGFIFQDFKLFSNDTVFNNAAFPLEVSSATSPFKKKRKVFDLLDIVGLKNRANDKVKNLSGGEKQRVAIARALANDPKLILADEPTGSLDNENSKNIMDLLEKISKKALVIVISHSKELTQRYADEVIEMKDGEISNHYYLQHKKDDTCLPIVINEFSNKKASLPSAFLIKHTINAIKERKWRTLFCNFITSLGLIGVGLAITLSSSISNNIKSTYVDIIGDSKVIVSQPSPQGKAFTLEAGSYVEAIEFSKKYNEYVVDIGTVYQTDYDSFFSSNDFLLSSNRRYSYIPLLSAKHINEFKWLDLYNSDFYPFRPQSLNDDEIVLGLNLSMVQSICYDLQIVRTVESLSDYLLNNDIYLSFSAENEMWGYSDEELFLLKAFSLEIEPCIYHYNHLWNETIFEGNMQLLSSTSFSFQDKYPWTMKKIYYFEIKNDVSTFISLIHSDIDSEEYIFEIASRQYFPNTYDYDTPIEDVSKVLFFINIGIGIHPKIADFILDTNAELSNPIFGSNGSYLILPSALMMGFANYAYFSFDNEHLIQSVDVFSTLPHEQNINIVMPDGIAMGHYSKSLQNGVNFQVFDKNILNKTIDLKVNEVFVSQGLLDLLKIDHNPINEPLYIAYQINEHHYGEDNIIREYSYSNLIVKGIINSSKISIYQNPDWLLTFFQCKLGVSAFDLLVNSISITVSDKDKIESVIKNLKRDFPEYEIINPMSSITESVEDVCGKLEIGVTLFSLIAVVISTILLAVCNRLHTLEIINDVGLSRCIGIKKYESLKFLFAHSLIMCLISFFLSSIELVFISLLTSASVSSILGGSLHFSFNPLALGAMFLLSIILSMITTLIVSIPFLKASPLEQLKH